MMNKLAMSGLLGLILTSTGWAEETLIYKEVFNESGPLHGKTSHYGNRKWVASPNFLADGNISDEKSNGSATLPFNPQPGRTYILEARVSATVFPDSSYVDWIAIGYANGQSTKISSCNRFTFPTKGKEPLCQGKAWAFIRPAFNKPEGGNNNDAFLDGTTFASSFSEYARVSELRIRIVLDTTKTPWTATWYAKPPKNIEYTKVVPETPLEAMDITSVGFAKSNAPGTIDNFSVSVVQTLEPGELLKTIGPETKSKKTVPTQKVKPAVKTKPAPAPKPAKQEPPQPEPEKAAPMGLLTS